MHYAGFLALLIFFCITRLLMKYRQIRAILAQQDRLKKTIEIHSSFEPDHKYRLESMEILVRIQQGRLDTFRKPLWEWLVEFERKMYEYTSKR